MGDACGTPAAQPRSQSTKMTGSNRPNAFMIPPYSIRNAALCASTAHLEIHPHNPSEILLMTALQPSPPAGWDTSRPRASFILKNLSGRVTRNDISRMIKERLTDHCDSVRVIRWLFFLPVSLMKLQLNGGAYRLGIVRRKHRNPKNVRWYVDIEPIQSRALNKTPESQRELHASELRQICQQVHAALSATPGIAQLCWYFEAWNGNTPGMRTPDELPWL